MTGPPAQVPAIHDLHTRFQKHTGQYLTRQGQAFRMSTCTVAVLKGHQVELRRA
jgi:hypothetical protein